MTTTPDREERFRALYARTCDDVVRFAQRRAHPSHAEDVAAETFTVVWRRLEDCPRPPHEARAWVFGIARNCLLNARRGAGRQEAVAVRLAEQDARPLPAAATDPVESLARVDLIAAWSRLDPREQETIALTAFDDLTSSEAARVLAISPAAYRVRLMRARRSLRHLLADADPVLPQLIPTGRTTP